jgi:biofilm PGA synthesis protein PgaD
MIINVERTRTLLARVIDLVLTIVAWILFVMLLYRGVVDSGTGPESGPRPIVPDALSTLDTLTLYIIVALINAAILIGWALYNQMRFRGRDRRQPIGPLSDNKIAESFRVKTSSLAELRGSRFAVVFHDEGGEIRDIQGRRIIPDGNPASG